ncbi:hypothetical protein E0500_023300 [Streptomyces sp. KM273126]|uniref:hypothetical protein n=1 Tax=Streptomyces sp. KM273126 TaxID=2545247 RepID=UPI00103B683B|nr:hypothetical protein [Streptomyces sp. KM273126]MBA2810239.1 hypothetical protein [Streptomyces sp. KM273126]
MARTGAVVLALLAALMHVLACAHGPTSTAAGRADSVLLKSSATCGQATEQAQQTTARQTPPAHHSGVRCWGLDEPTVQPPRDVTLADPTVQDAASAGHLDDQPNASSALQHSPPTPGVPSAGQTRARIGVWRT